MSRRQEESESLLGTDLVLLLMAAPTRVRSAQGRINGITRLEKLLYLAHREANVSKFVEAEPLTFVPYDYGPYSRGVYEAVDFLESMRLLQEEKALNGRLLDEIEEFAAAEVEAEGVERRFSLTEQGRAVAELLARQHPEVVKRLSDVKEKYARMPLRQLIRYVYAKYPESAERSRIKDDV